MKKVNAGKSTKVEVEKNSNRDPNIAHYEEFLKAVGFKRSDGSIFGLLALSAEPLSSEDIGRSLGLSQGAVSQGLKNLAHWGAIESRYSSQKRAQLHGAVNDSLTIVSTIFQKREKGAIETFRRANEAARDRFLSDGAKPESERIVRLNSYVTTCEFAQVVGKVGEHAVGGLQFSASIAADAHFVAQKFDQKVLLTLGDFIAVQLIIKDQFQCIGNLTSLNLKIVAYECSRVQVNAVFFDEVQ